MAAERTVTAGSAGDGVSEVLGCATAGASLSVTAIVCVSPMSSPLKLAVTSIVSSSSSASSSTAVIVAVTMLSPAARVSS